MAIGLRSVCAGLRPKFTRREHENGKGPAKTVHVGDKRVKRSTQIQEYWGRIKLKHLGANGGEPNENTFNAQGGERQSRSTLEMGATCGCFC